MLYKTATRAEEPLSLKIETSTPSSKGPARPLMATRSSASIRPLHHPPSPAETRDRAGDRSLYPGEAKTDAKDAAVIADAARTMPHTLRSLEVTDEITAELTVLVGFDQDLAVEANRTSNPHTAACSPSSTPAWSASWGPT